MKVKEVELPIDGFELKVYGNYSVRLTQFKDPVLDAEIFGYGIYNRTTNVREAECRRSWTANLIAQKFDEDDHAPQAPVVDVPTGAPDVRGMH